MDKKLTLSLNESVIESAKKYAKNNQTSLSKLIEAYLLSIIEKKTQEIEITPLVKSLSGVFSLPNNFDVREEYTDFLIEKYQ